MTQLESITGGEETTSTLGTIGRWAGTAGRWAGTAAKYGLPVVNAGFAVHDGIQAWNQSRDRGESGWVAGAKAAGAGVESATWPIIPLAREAFSVNPAY